MSGCSGRRGVVRFPDLEIAAAEDDGRRGAGEQERGVVFWWLGDGTAVPHKLVAERAWVMRGPKGIRSWSIGTDGVVAHAKRAAVCRGEEGRVSDGV